MPTNIRIRVGDVVLEGELNDGPHARELAAALPIEGSLCTFGDSYYVETEVDRDPGADGTDQIDVGDIGYWHPALAMQFFFGPTPESLPGSEKPVPAGEVVKLGTFRDARKLAAARRERRIRVEGL